MYSYRITKQASVGTIAGVAELQTVALDSAGEMAADLPCAACSYNLRGLAMSGACPECGRPVQVSLDAAASGFGSVRRIRRLRRGLAIWAVARAAPAVGLIYFTCVTLAGAWFWDELRDRQSVFARLWRAGVPVWAYGFLVANVLQPIAVIWLVNPVVLRCEQSRRRLGHVAFALAVFALLSQIFERVFRWLGAWTGTWDVTGTICYIGYGASPVAALLVWLYLILEARGGSHRHLRWVMWIALAAPALLCAYTCVPVALLLTAPPVSATGTDFAFAPPAWWMSLNGIYVNWYKYGDNVCGVVMLLAIWAYVRKLNAAARAIAGK